MNIVITTLFGLETLTRHDLESIGYLRDNITVSDGQVILKVPDDTFAADIARVNMWAGCAERVFFEVGSFKAEEFDRYFDQNPSFSQFCFNFLRRQFSFAGAYANLGAIVYPVPNLRSCTLEKHVLVS